MQKGGGVVFKGKSGGGDYPCFKVIFSRKDAKDAKKDIGFRILDTGFRKGWSRRWGSRKDAKDAKRDIGFRILDTGFRKGWSRRWGSRKDAKDAKRPTYRIDNKKISKETAS